MVALAVKGIEARAVHAATVWAQLPRASGHVWVSERGVAELPPSVDRLLGPAIDSEPVARVRDASFEAPADTIQPEAWIED